MKKLKTFENYSNGDAVETTPENIKAIIKYQKENGGVIRIQENDEKTKQVFSENGYEIIMKSIDDIFADKQIQNDIENFNKVNYVICILPNNDLVSIFNA